MVGGVVLTCSIFSPYPHRLAHRKIIPLPNQKHPKMKLLLTLFLATAALANAQCTPSVTDVVWIAADTDTIGASFPANGDAGLWCDNTGEELAWWFIVDDCGKTIKTVTITTKQNGKLIRDEKEAFYPYMSFGDYSS